MKLFFYDQIKEIAIIFDIIRFFNFFYVKKAKFTCELY